MILRRIAEAFRRQDSTTGMLHGMNDAPRAVSDRTPGLENDLHRQIGFTGLLDHSEVINGIDARRARITAPGSVARKDGAFADPCCDRERTHASQFRLRTEMKNLVSSNVATLRSAP